jgi:hypothetical protein
LTGDYHAALHCVNKTTGARVWKTPTGKQIQSRLAAGVSRSANMYVGVYGNCLYACDSCSGILLRWKSCTADIPLGMISTRQGATVSLPRMVVDVCSEAGWSPRRRSSWTKRRFVIESSTAQAMGTSTASMRPAVSHGNQNSPPQSAASPAAADRAVISETASRTWARSASPGAISVHTGAVIVYFALSSAPRDELYMFVGASPRRGTGVWRDILYVAGEEWVPLRAEHFSRGEECNTMAHASNTTAVRAAGWRATIRPAL